MRKNEEHLNNIQEKKQKIRDRYKGIDADELEVIPAVPQDDFYNEERHLHMCFRRITIRIWSIEDRIGI